MSIRKLELYCHIFKYTEIQSTFLFIFTIKWKVHGSNAVTNTQPLSVHAFLHFNFLNIPLVLFYFLVHLSGILNNFRQILHHLLNESVLKFSCNVIELPCIL